MADTATSTASTTSGTSPAGRGLTIAAFILAGLALLFGLLTAIPALICGIIGHTKGDRLARWAIAASVAGGIAGVVLGAVAMNAIN